MYSDDTKVLNEDDLDSPAFTGTPTAPTASSGTSTTQIATTAFVSNAISDTTDEIESEIPIVNLLPSVYQWESLYGNSYTNRGITWTVNQDGSITATGTATGDSSFCICEYKSSYDVPLLYVDTSKSYTFSGCPSGGTSSTYRMRMCVRSDETSGTAAANYYDYGDGVTFTPTTKYINCYCTVFSGTTVSDLTFYPMLEVGDTAHDYVSTHHGTWALANRISEIEGDLGGHTVATDVPSGAVFTDTTYSDFTGATASTDGSDGLVPAPTAAYYQYFLRGDGSWALPSVGDASTVNGHTVYSDVPASAEFTDTLNTAGSTDTASKIYLVGATAQASSSQTYSQDTAYVGTDGCLYSDDTKVLTEDDLDSPTFTGTPLAPTASSGTSTTQIATTAFVSDAVEDAMEAILGDFATIETSTTASQAYAIGEYFILNNLLYRVTTAISSGGTITVGTNCTQTTVADEMTNNVLYFTSRTVSAVTSGTICTISDSRITTNHVVASAVWGNSSYITTDVTCTTSAGSAVFTGTCTTATTLTVVLVKKDN